MQDDEHSTFIIRGSLVQMPAPGKLNVLKNAVLGVRQGKVLLLEENQPGLEDLDERCRQALADTGIDSRTVRTITLQVVTDPLPRSTCPLLHLDDRNTELHTRPKCEVQFQKCVLAESARIWWEKLSKKA